MLYAIGRIVLFAPRGSPLVVDEQMTGLARAAGEEQRNPLCDRQP